MKTRTNLSASGAPILFDILFGLPGRIVLCASALILLGPGLRAAVENPKDHTTEKTQAPTKDDSQAPSQARSQELSSKDQKFVTEAAEAGMAEVELGKIAQQKAKNPAVRDFGNMMAADHSQANEKLKSLAEKKAV